MRTKTPTVKITTNNIIKWLFSQEDLPNLFTTNKSKFMQSLQYIHEALLNYPRAILYLNGYINTREYTIDPFELAHLYKKIIRTFGIQRNNLYRYIPQRDPNNHLIKKVQTFEQCTELDAISIVKMHIFLNKPWPPYIQETTTKAESKKTVWNSVAQNILNNIPIQETPEEAKPYSKFFDIMNQEIIDREELVIFDVQLLKKSNTILFIFIDGQDRKRYWKEPFKAEFYLSNSSSIIQNDYIMELKDCSEFSRYTTTDWNSFQKMKFQLNHNMTAEINTI